MFALAPRTTSDMACLLGENCCWHGRAIDLVAVSVSLAGPGHFGYSRFDFRFQPRKRTLRHSDEVWNASIHSAKTCFEYVQVLTLVQMEGTSIRDECMKCIWWMSSEACTLHHIVVLDHLAAC